MSRLKISAFYCVVEAGVRIGESLYRTLYAPIIKLYSMSSPQHVQPQVGRQAEALAGTLSGDAPKNDWNGRVSLLAGALTGITDVGGLRDLVEFFAE